MNLSNQPKNFSLLVIGCIALGIMIFITFSGLIIAPYIDIMQGKSFDPLSLPRLKLISLQVIQMLCLFTVPPILFALFSKNDFLHCFQLDKPFQPYKYLIATLLALALFPVIINIQYWVMQAPLPEFIRSIADSQRSQNELAMNLFLNHPGLPNLILMIAIVGVGAGLTEELFFRGFLMKWFEKINGNTWLAIIISASIFGLIHFNFYDLIAIIIAGIMFGYIYSKTNDLKLNIFLHALFNSSQVVLNFLYENNMISTNIEEVKSVPFLIWILCLVVVIFLIIKLVKSYEHLPHTS